MFLLILTIRRELNSLQVVLFSQWNIKLKTQTKQVGLKTFKNIKSVNKYKVCQIFPSPQPGQPTDHCCFVFYLKNKVYQSEDISFSDIEGVRQDSFNKRWYWLKLILILTERREKPWMSGLTKDPGWALFHWWFRSDCQ